MRRRPAPRQSLPRPSPLNKDAPTHALRFLHGLAADSKPQRDSGFAKIDPQGSPSLAQEQILLLGPDHNDIYSQNPFPNGSSEPSVLSCLLRKA
jgi:hypothetical protein